MGMLLGLLRPSSGSIRLFHDKTCGVHQQALHRIGAIVENHAFYPYLSGRANLQFFQGIGRGGGRAEIDRLLAMVDLSSRAESKYQTYSLGMKQRLGIAYTLLGDPELVFLDEPTNGLDPAGVAEVRDLIRALAADGRTVVLSSHMLHEVEQVCDSVAILSNGRLIALGRVEDLIRQRGAVRLRTTDDAQARRILASVEGVSKVADDEGYIVAEVPPERSGELTRALSREEVFVTEMSPVQTSLERFFLDITTERLVGAAEEGTR
jgi:ABC-2 type transport system ATP-binding protein